MFSFNFPRKWDDAVMTMSTVLEYGAGNISRLLTNPVLFEAYEVAYANLEETYCPLFYLSDEYFQLLCGEKEAPKSTKGNIRYLKPFDIFTQIIDLGHQMYICI